MSRIVSLLLLASIASFPTFPVSAAGPEGQMTWAVHTSLAPTWFDPAETSGTITSFMTLYAR
jgi:peptide/nickel transport system substrate-binding protein